MKILEVNKFNFIQGGADKHFLDLVSLLKSKGNEVAVFAMHHPKNEFSPWKKYFVSYVGFKKEDSWYSKLKGLTRIYSWEAKKKIKKILDDFQPEVVHIHNIYHHISPSILSEIKKKKIPIVMTVHDYNLICPNYLLVGNNQNWENIRFKDLVRFIKNKGFKNSFLQSALVAVEYVFNKTLQIYEKNIDLYIVPSQFTKDKLVKSGIRTDRIIVQPHFLFNGIPHNKENYLLNERYAIYYGAINEEKEAEKLVNIFESLSGIKLYLAGSVAANFSLKESEKIKYLGFLDQTKLEKHISNSLFVVSHSRLPETFGLIALEAIKNGKPFVGFTNNSYSEIIENNKTGYLCQDEREFKEKIQKMTEDEGLRILFSRNAQERAKDFDSQHYYERIIRIFREASEIPGEKLTFLPVNDNMWS